MTSTFPIPILVFIVMAASGRLQAQPDLVQFSTNRFQVVENAGSAMLSVVRSGNLSGTITVDFASSDATARAGVDYVAAAGQLTFTPGQTNTLLPVMLLDDPLVNGDRTLTVRLLNPGGGVILGSVAETTLEIRDNEQPVLLDPFFKRTVTTTRNDAVLQPDGKIVAVGDESPRVIRLNPDGTKDLSFTNASPNGEARAVALQPDGKLLVAGSFRRWGSHARAGIVRLNTDGGLDAGFDITDPNITNSPPFITALTLQPDGKVLIGGNIGTNHLVRLVPDGALDQSFSCRIRLDALAMTIALQPDGKVIVGGNFVTLGPVRRVNLARLNSDGSVDAAYAQDLAMSTGSLVTALLPLPDGSLYLGGNFTSVAGQPRKGLARLRPDGSLDPDFNPALKSLGLVQTLFLDGKGRLMVGGDRFDIDQSGSFDYCLVRLRSDSSVDRSYLPILASDFILRLAPDLDGGFVAAGRTGVLHLLNSDNTLHGFTLAGGSPGLATGGATTLNLTVAENSSQVTLSVLRLGGSEASATVNYTTTERSARDGRDFTAQTGTLLFNPLETAKTITIPILNNDLVETIVRTFSVTLSDASGGAHLDVGAAKTVISIENNDFGVALDGWTSFFGDPGYGYSVAELAGSVDITIKRDIDNASKAITVPYQLQPDTAREGVDYTGTSGEVTFAVGETNRVLRIPIHSDHGMIRPDRTFTVTLGTPNGGAPLGSPVSARVLILDTERPGSLDPAFQLDPQALAGATTLFDDGSAFPSAGLDFGPVAGADDLLILPNGHLVVALVRNYIAAVVGLLPDGSADPGFKGIVVKSQWLNGWNNEPLRLVQDAAGRVVVAGYIPDSSGNLRGALFRLGRDGTLDPSFRTRFARDRTLDAGGDFCPCYTFGSLAIQSDGQLLVAGSSTVSDRRLTRLHEDGSEDQSLANVQLTLEGNESAWITEIVPQSDGRILISGKFDAINGIARPQLARLNADGSVDTTFDPGKGGTINLNSANQAKPPTMALLPSGQLIVGGEFTQFDGTPADSLVRLKPNGTVDPSFRPRLRSNNAISYSVLALALQPDGRIVVCGYESTLANSSGFSVLRLEADGVLNEAYSSGVGAAPFFVSRLPLPVLRLQRDGGVLVGSTSILTRLRGDPPLQFSRPSHSGSGQSRFQLTNRSGKPALIEASTDLVHWLPMQTNAADQVSAELDASVPTPIARRFFRATVKP